MPNKKEEPVVEMAPYNGDVDKDNKFQELYTKFQDYKQHRDQTVHFLNKNGIARNIIDYVKDGVDRTNEYHLKPEYKDAWQSNIFDPVTRNKVIAVLSKIASARMTIDVMCRYNSIFSTKDSMTRAKIYKDLLDAANEHNREDEQLIWEMFTGMTEGTVIGYESWMKDKRTANLMTEFNPDTGEYKTESVTYDSWDDVYGQIVPINEFYPQTIWANSRDFKIKIKRCFWVREMTEESFRDQFGRYKNAEKVKPAGFWADQQKMDWGIDASLIKAGNYQIFEWFDEVKDRHYINVNGVELYDGPLEWNHKRKPFWLAIAEPIHHQFLYGKSLPDKLMAMQDMDNAMLNNVLDQMLLVLNSPIFISGNIDDITDGYLEPNRVYQMDTDGKVERGALSNVDQTSFQVLQLIKRSMDESSMPTEQQGVATGGRKTKYEVQTLQENALNIAGLFLQLMESAMRDKYLLRMYNVIQYYAQPSESMGGSTKFKFLTLDNRKLTNGKIGKKMIQIVPSLNGKTQEEVKSELEDVGKIEMGSEEYNPATATVEPVVVTSDYLTNKEVELDIKIVPNSSVKDSQTTRKNNSVTFYQMANGDPRYNQQMLAEDLAETFDKSPDIVNPQQAGPMSGGLEEQMAQAQQLMGRAIGSPEGVGMADNSQEVPQLEPM